MFKRIIKFGFIVLFIFAAADLVYAAEQPLTFLIKNSTGDWEKVLLDDRQAIATDKSNAVQTLNIDIPEDGYYQLYISLYHQWRKYCPFIYIKLTDAQGKHYYNYVFSEQRWYLPHGQGRWEYRSPSAEPFWKLRKGKAKIRFWADSKNSCWEQKTMKMEGKIFIDKFILIEVDTRKMLQQNEIILK
ncbi:MAG: hypothetical protein V1747_02010 [Candidatus Omnitrophota bacterium]